MTGITILISGILPLLTFFYPLLLLGTTLLLASAFKALFNNTVLVDFGAAVYLKDVLLILVMAAIAASFMRGRFRLNLSGGLQFLIVLWILYGFISMIRGVLLFGPPGIGEARDTFLLIFLAFYIMNFCRDYLTIMRIMKMVYGLALLVAIISVSLIVMRLMLEGSLYRPLPTTGGLLIGTGFIIGVASRKNRNILKIRLRPTLLVLLFLLTALILNAHRSAWVGTLFGFASLHLLHTGGISIRKILKLGIIAGTVTIMAFYLSQGVLSSSNPMLLDTIDQFRDERLAFLEKGYEADYSAQWRVIAWLMELERIRDKPVFGSGFGNRLTLEHHRGGPWLSIQPHNAHLEILSRQGLVGYLLFIAMLFSLVRTMSRVGKFDPQAKGFSILISALIIMNLTYSIFYSLEYIFWIITGLALAVANLRRSPPVLSKDLYAALGSGT